MKILFITNATYVNYTESCLFHGLVKSGHDVVDSTYLWYMSKMSPDIQKQLYGKGFTIFGLLDDRKNVDRTNIKDRILSKEFDCIIYGNGTIRGNSLQYFNDVLSVYPKNKIAVCDGGDETTLERSIIPQCRYFKRELVSNEAFPISYAIPEEKLIAYKPTKNKILATLIPGNKSTYVYDNEKDYYNAYAESMFGVTTKKCGWDCLRHYEIIANRCLPYFKDFDSCPTTTMSNWPRKLQLDANKMYDKKDFLNYQELCEEFFEYCKQKLITKALAKYVLSKLNI